MTTESREALRDRLFDISTLVECSLTHIQGPDADLGVPLRLLRMIAERLDGITATLEPPLPSPSGASPCEHVRALGEQRCLHCGDQLPMTWPTAVSPQTIAPAD